MRDSTDLFVGTSCYSGAENTEEALLSATKLNDLAPGSGAVAASALLRSPHSADDLRLVMKDFRLHCPKIISVLTLIFIFAASGFAQTQTASAHDADQDQSSPKITGVSGKLQVGEEIVFSVAHLSEWAQSHDPQKLVPFIEGRSLNGLYPEQVDLSQNQLRYHLRRTAATQKVWNDLFHEPVLRRPVAISLGLEGRTVFASVFDYDHQLPMTIIPVTWGIVSLVAVVLTLVVFIFLARTTSLIRDPSPTSEPSSYRPYSLGRAQMAFWFILIFICYVSLWLITGDYDTIGRSQFVLAAITSFTAVASHLASGPTLDVDYAPTLTKGFFVDLVSDSNGVRFHRFQLCAWTILLGLIFAATVFDDLVMPEFGDTLLALAGISAATHVTFTYVEHQRGPSELERL